MPLTRSFDETIRESAQSDPEFRAMLLPDTIDLLLADDVRVGKIALRQCIYATIGFERLASLTGKSPKASGTCSIRTATPARTTFSR